jgi:hypothetical protein
VTVVVEVGEEAVNIEIGGTREAVISAEAETKALAITSTPSMVRLASRGSVP